MKVLLTGGAGFIGSHIAERLIADGHDVRVVDMLHPWAHESDTVDLPGNVDFHRADLNDPASLASLCRGSEAVCHQASVVGMDLSFADATEYVANNCLATAALLKALEATSFAGRVVLASSMVVYGEGAYECPSHGRVRPLPRARDMLERGRFDPLCPHGCGELAPRAVDESLEADPRSIYAATKLHQEHLCSIFGRARGLPVAMLRYHNVYGDRMPRNTPYAGVASIFLSALRMGGRPQVFEDGNQLRDFIHVDDVAEANALALSRPEPATGSFNISTGRPRTVGEMAHALATAVGRPEAPVVSGEFRTGDVRHVFASPAKARADLGFVARIDFGAGMRRLAASPRPDLLQAERVNR